VEGPEAHDGVVYFAVPVVGDVWDGCVVDCVCAGGATVGVDVVGVVRVGVGVVVGVVGSDVDVVGVDVGVVGVGDVAIGGGGAGRRIGRIGTPSRYPANAPVAVFNLLLAADTRLESRE
jgi:hypothetical protein